MRVGIDARFLTHPQVGGFKTYTLNLVAAIASVDAENDYVLYLDRQPDRNGALPDSPRFSYRVVPGSLPLIGMPWREQFLLPAQAARDGLDLFHAPALTAPLRLPCPLVLTVHDMLWRHPRAYSPARGLSINRKLMQTYYRLVPGYAARQAAAVVTVSQTARQEILRELGLPPERIFVTYEAAGPAFHAPMQSSNGNLLEQRHNLAPPFLLALGSADPRKNLSAVIQAYSCLPAGTQARYPLVIVWANTLLAAELHAHIRSLGLKDRVYHLFAVSDQDLAGLYRAATLFLFPSYGEGFGLPPLEAMACGTPVLAANNSSLPEVLGDAAALVDAADPQAIAKTIASLLANPDLRQNMAERGLQRAAGFSWQRCAEQIIAIYRKVAL